MPCDPVAGRVNFCGSTVYGPDNGLRGKTIVIRAKETVQNCWAGFPFNPLLFPPGQPAVHGEVRATLYS